MKHFFTLLAAVFLSGCTIPGSTDDFHRRYFAGTIKDSIDTAVQEEIRKDVPNGYKTKPYSREIWNAYWNSRIFYLHDIGQTKETRTYRGPSGPEFARYIVETRRTNGLPELKIEERNRDKIP